MTRPPVSGDESELLVALERLNQVYKDGIYKERMTFNTKMVLDLLCMDHNITTKRDRNRLRLRMHRASNALKNKGYIKVSTKLLPKLIVSRQRILELVRR